MKLVLCSLSLFLLLGLAGVPCAQAQIDDTFALDENTVSNNEGLVATCAKDFSEDTILRSAVQLRIQHKGVANLDAGAAHAFAADYFNSWCANADCHDPVTAIVVCAEL